MWCNSAIQRMTTFFQWQTDFDIPSWSQLQRQWWPQSAWSRVRSHLSPCITLAGPNTVPPPRRTFADPVTLTWPEGWFMYTMWQCSPLRCVPASSQSTWNNPRTADDDVQRPGVGRLSFSTVWAPLAFIKWVYASGKKSKTKTKLCIMTPDICCSMILFLPSCVVFLSHAAHGWCWSIDYDLNVCLLYGEV